MCLLILLWRLEDMLASKFVIMFRRVSHWRGIYRCASLSTDLERLLYIIRHILRESVKELLVINELRVDLLLLEVHAVIGAYTVEPRLIPLILLIYI